MKSALFKHTRYSRLCFPKLGKVVFLSFLSCFFFNFGLFAQQQLTVKGKVVDQTGEPIIGASVVVVESKLGTMTDADGNFTVSTSPNGSIKVSYLGFITQIIKVDNKTSISVKMEEDAKALDEVVVVGYGTQRLKDVTGAIVPVDMKKVEALPFNTITEGLLGQIPGLSVSMGSGRPGALDASLSIRQNFSFSKDGGNELPLIIIDDVIQIDPETGASTMTQFNLLDPSEVESITVLKDASAAIYGSRAAQGAIIVKTKKGQEGKPKISYAGKFLHNDAVSHGKVMNANEYGVFANSLLRASGTTKSENLFSDEELETMKSLNYNWLDEAWSPATSMQHSLNVNGGTQRATYFAGASYINQGANMGQQDFDRWTFRAGSEVKVTDGLKLSATVAANTSDVTKSFTKLGLSGEPYGTGGEQADYALLLHMPQYIPWQISYQGEDYWVSPMFGPKNLAGNQATNGLAGWNYFGFLNNGSKVNDKVFSTNANFSLVYDIPFVKGLSVKGTYAIQYVSNNTEQAHLPLMLARATNSNTEGNHLVNENTKWDIKVNDKQSRVMYRKEYNKLQQMNFFLTYDRKFGDHNVSAMGSVEKGISRFEQMTTLYDTPLAGYLGDSRTAGTLNTNNSQTVNTDGGTLSYLGRVSYGFKNKYLAQLVFRSDASTKFSPDHYWGFFPGLSAGWVMTEEDWFKFKWLDFFKLRASIGKTGQDNVKYWRWKELFDIVVDKGLGFGSNGGRLVTGLTPNVSPNPDLRWDSNIKYNVGFDFNVLNNRLGGSLDGYIANSTNMLIDLASLVGTPISVGGGKAEVNYATVRSYGLELNLTWRDKIGDVSYSVGMNYGIGDNKVLRFPELGFNYPGANQVMVGSSMIMPYWGYLTWKGTSSGDGLLRTDQDIDNYWAYLEGLATAAGTKPSYMGITSKSGLRKGMLAYQDLAGDLDPNTQTIAGPNGQVSDKNQQDMAKLANKNRTYSINTPISVSWKDFSFSTLINTSWGGVRMIDYVKQGVGSSNFLWSHESFLTDMYDEANNVDGRWPNLAFQDQNLPKSDFWMLPTFRCYVRNLSIGYNIPKRLLTKTGIANVKLSLTGTNLWDFYNPYPDKYRNMYDSPTSDYPTLRTWAFGINASF